MLILFQSHLTTPPLSLTHFMVSPINNPFSVLSGGRHNPLSICKDDKTNSTEPHLLHTPFILTKKEVNDCCSQLHIIAQNKYSRHSVSKSCLNNIPKLDCTHNKNICLCQADLDSLQPVIWLNDNIIQFYLLWLFKSTKEVLCLDSQQLSSFLVKDKKHHYLDSTGKNQYLDSAGFHNQLIKKNYLFDAKMILVPFNVNQTHWKLIAIVNHHNAECGNSPSLSTPSYLIFDSLWSCQNNDNDTPSISTTIEFLGDLLLLQFNHHFNEQMGRRVVQDICDWNNSKFKTVMILLKKYQLYDTHN